MIHCPAQFLQFLKLLRHLQLAFDALLAGIDLLFQSSVLSLERFIGGIILPHLRLHPPVSYTHLRAHETKANLVCRLLLEKNFFNDTATTEIYTYAIVGSVRCV